MADTRPTLLLTRPERDAVEFARYFPDIADRIVISPTTTIEFMPIRAELSRFESFIFTSVNGVRAVEGLAGFAKKTAFCVGNRTAKEAGLLGLQPKSANGSVEELVKMIADLRPKGELLHLHGCEHKGKIVERLNELGIKANGEIAYVQKQMTLNQEALSCLSGKSPIVIPLFSPRSAERLSEQIKRCNAPIYLVAISENAAKAWTGQSPVKFTVAKHPDAPHIKAEIATIWSQLEP